MIIAQEKLIKQISDNENIDIVIVRKIFESIENIIFNYMSSVAPSENIVIKLLNGVNIERNFIKKKKYTKGMFQDIECPDRVKVKASSSRYYTKKVNDELVNKKLFNR